MAKTKVTPWFRGVCPVREGWYEFNAPIGWGLSRSVFMAYYRPELMTWHPKKNAPGYALASFDWWRGLAKPPSNA